MTKSAKNAVKTTSAAYQNPPKKDKSSEMDPVQKAIETPLTPSTKRVKSELAKHEKNKTIDTPIKARIAGAIEYMEAKGLQPNKSVIFQFFNVSHRSGYRILEEDSSCTLNTRVYYNPRHHPRAITEKQIQKMENILESRQFADKALTWEQLATEAGCHANMQAVKHIMGTMDYHKCIACRKG